MLVEGNELSVVDSPGVGDGVVDVPVVENGVVVEVVEGDELCVV